MQKSVMQNRGVGMLASRNRQKGTVLVVGLLIIMVLTMVAVNASKRTVVQERMANNYRFSIEAMNNAETGSFTALNLLNDQNLSLNGFDDELDLNGDGDFDDRFSLSFADADSNVFFNVVLVDDDDGDGNPSVDSNGIVLLMSQGISSFGSTRTTEVRISDAAGAVGAIPLDKAILAQESITFSGDSEYYGSNQNIHSNADIYQAEHPIITSGHMSAVGTVYGVPQGGGTTESGTSLVEIPQIDPAMFADYADYIFESDGKIYDADGDLVADADGNAYQGWKFGGDKWTTEGTNVLGGMLYFRGEHANVSVASAPGTAIDPWLISILADGWIELSGNPIVANYMDPDDPPAVQAIMFMSGSDIKINGNANQRFNGIIAAREQFHISGNPVIEGALISSGESNDSDLVVENSISGVMQMTYDGGLSLFLDDGAADGISVVLSWRDREIARDTGVFNLEVAGNGY